METIVYSFDKEALFDRCSVDIAMYSEHSELQVDMCEHDRSWFDVALYSASCVVMQELSRIAKDAELPMVDDPSYVDFHVMPINSLQKRLLYDAIERYLISHTVNMWYMQRFKTPVLDISEPLSQLKHVTLMNNGINRKPSY